MFFVRSFIKIKHTVSVKPSLYSTDTIVHLNFTYCVFLSSNHTWRHFESRNGRIIVKGLSRQMMNDFPKQPSSGLQAENSLVSRAIPFVPRIFSTYLNDPLKSWISGTFDLISKSFAMSR